jgi:ligand-binding sensor domain-containing protein
MFRYSHILLFLLSTLPLNGRAQQPHYQLETLGTRNGLLSSKAYALMQASDRMLWIGTELGVSVYDGYRFVNHQYTTTNEPVGRVLCITEDSLHTVWIGGDRGLFYCTNGSVRKIEPRSRALLAVEALVTDAQGNVWAGDINNLYKITAAQTRQVQLNNTGTIELSPFAAFSKRVHSLCTDSKQNVYAGSFDGVFKIPANTNRYQQIWVNPEPHHPVISVAATSPDSIFWNCIERFPRQMVMGKVSSVFDGTFIGTSVFTAQYNAFALTTAGVGRITNSAVQPLVLFGGNLNNAVAALVDAEENIWVASWEGLLKYRKTAFTQYQLPQGGHKEVFSFLEKKNGGLLFGSNRGNVFIKKNDAFTTAQPIPVLFPLAEVMCMYEDGDGGLWAGSGYQGIARFKNNTLTRWKDTGFVKDNNCEALYPAGDGRLFACTENGVTVINPLSLQPMTAHYPFQKNYTRRPELFGCFQNGASPYWFYGSKGLFRLVNEMLVEDSIDNMPVKGLYINKITSDKKGAVWVATLGKGLLQCRYTNGKLVMQKQYDSRNGLPTDNILSVLADKNDDIWCGDYMSISVLKNNGAGNPLITFNEKDGLLAAYYQTLKLEQQRNGVIWGLTSTGLVSFHPDSINRNNLAPSLFINHVSAGGLYTDFSAQPAASFKYNQNSLHFGFVAVCLTDASKVRYAYRLKELDSNWTYTTSQTVDFMFLRPGAYTFELRACNNNNVWTAVPLQFPFTIRPPFWKTWWFTLLIVLLTAAAVLAVFRVRIRSLKAKAAVQQQITELEAKALRAQMNPHFIFNSLNAIQELIITGNTDEGYRYLSDFSKLLRMVLNNSEKNLIPLSSELEMIQLYLSLESLRFKNSFHYAITIHEDVEAEMTAVPPLLLQPFVENAVWHGLRNKPDNKNLSIRVSEAGERLVIEIEDNGVGRQKALAIKQQKIGAGEFDSKGSSLSQQRIAIVNQQYPNMAQIDIKDLVAENNEPLGTKVTITLPLHTKTGKPA